MSSTVCLVFTRNWLPGSLAIRAVTWSRWSHVGIVDGDHIIEAALFGGVRRRPLADLINESSAHAFSCLRVADSNAVIKAAESQIGKRFDLLGALSFLALRDLQQRDAWFCSELVAWCAHIGGSPLFRESRIGRVSPEHLWMLAPAGTA